MERTALADQVVVVLTRVLTRARRDLGGEQIHDRAVLVGGPHGAVVTQEARSGALLAAKTAGAVEQAGYEPFEANRHFGEATPQSFHDAIDDAATHQRLAYCGVRGPLRPMAEQITNRHREVV